MSAPRDNPFSPIAEFTDSEGFAGPDEGPAEVAPSWRDPALDQFRWTEGDAAPCPPPGEDVLHTCAPPPDPSWREDQRATYLELLPVLTHEEAWEAANGQQPENVVTVRAARDWTWWLGLGVGLTGAGFAVWGALTGRRLFGS